MMISFLLSTLISSSTSLHQTQNPEVSQSLFSTTDIKTAGTRGFEGNIERTELSKATETSGITGLTGGETEKEIPVILEKNSKKESSGDSTYLRVLMATFICGLMGWGFYTYLRRRTLRGTHMKNMPHIKILAQQYLGPKKSLVLIRVAGESILIGATDNQINLIKSLSLLTEDIPDEVPKEFSTVFTDTSIRKDERNSSSNLKPHFPNGTTNINPLEDEFSFSGIRDIFKKTITNNNTNKVKN